MARIALIYAIVLWSVCKGYEIHEPESSSTVDQPKYKCHRDGMFAYPPDCTMYILCSHGYHYIMPCPDGLHYGKFARSCVTPREARCTPVANEEHATEYPDDPTDYTTDVYTDEPYTETTEGPVSPKVKFSCYADGLFSYPPDCTRFIQCSNRRAFVMKCPEGLHFSKRISRCDYPCEAQCDPALSHHCKEEKALAKDVCSLPRKKGQCKSYVVRYYYDVTEAACKKFVFGGCNGNGNNFKSEKQCMEVCGRVGAKETTTEDSTDTYQTSDPWGYSRFKESTDAPWISEDDTRWTSENDASWTSNDDTDWTTEDGTSWTSKDDTSWTSENDASWTSENDASWTTKDDTEWTSEDDASWTTTDDTEWTTEDGSEWLSTDSSSTAYSSKATVRDDLQCHGNGAYRNPDDCRSFIWCPLDRAVVVPCPPNHHYSEERNACVDPCLAHCNASLACHCGWPECHRPIDCESDPDVGPCQDRELRYFYDQERGRCKSFYYGGCHGNGNNFRTLLECQRECQVAQLAGFRCPSYNGDFGHFPDCVSYYHCKRGIPTLKKCPKGTAFHHLKAKCVPEEQAMCVYECREANAVYPTTRDRHSYIDCVNGIPRLEKCPRGLVFDVIKRNCILERSTSWHLGLK